MAVTEGRLLRFSWQADAGALAERLHVQAEDRDLFDRVLARARQAYAPRAWVCEAKLEALGDDFAQLSGHWFEGARVAACLAGAHRVWAYVVTAGPTPAPQGDDMLESWWLQALGEEAVHAAMERLIAQTPARPGEHVNAVSPGSLPDWPIEQQRPLFALLGAPNAGVSLTDACLIEPRCSLSGLLYTAGEAYCSCAYCLRAHCPNRRAPAMQ